MFLAIRSFKNIKEAGVYTVNQNHMKHYSHSYVYYPYIKYYGNYTAYSAAGFCLE